MSQNKLQVALVICVKTGKKSKLVPYSIRSFGNGDDPSFLAVTL